MDITSFDYMALAFLLMLGVAGFAAAAGILNLGADRVIERSELDLPPVVVNTPVTTITSAVVGLGLALLIAIYLTPLLSLLGLFVGVWLAGTLRSLRLGAWRDMVTRDMQVLVTQLVIQLSSGSDSLYRAIEISIDNGRYDVLKPILERHVLARKVSGAPLDQCLSDLATCRLLRDTPLVQSVFGRIASLARRGVPTDTMMEAITQADEMLTEIVKIEKKQEAASAQTRGSAYFVALLLVVMAGAVLVLAPTLRQALLATVPGNITLMLATVLIMISLAVADRAAYSRPMKF